MTYSDLTGIVRLSRFAVPVGGDPDLADPDSEVIMLTVPRQNARHQGGALAFGPDGYLYMGAGDGGHGLNTDVALTPAYLPGKVLRLDVDGGEPYAIPPDNPFVGVAGAREEIYAVGLRNPWRMAFDSKTGDLFFGDVGEDNWEEIDVIPAGTPGLNFGWPCYEAFDRLVFPDCGPESDYTWPIFAYAHDDSACSVTGGTVYRGSQFPELYGFYVFGDFCTGRTWGLVQDDAAGWQSVNLGYITGELTTFGAGFDGELFYSALQTGNIYRLGTGK